ncbi:MAG: CBS domain-containing protein [Hyphomicrobiaceae bacterium]
MHVTSILNDKGRKVETASTTATIGEIVEKLAALQIGAVVIIRDSGEVAGIVSERDVVQGIAQFGAEVLQWPASKVMTEDVVTCSEDDTVDELMARMTEYRFRHLPVISGDRLNGIISIGDVVKHRVAEIELEASAMRDYIKTG